MVKPQDMRAESLERMSDGTYRVRCMNCGKSVSSALVEPVTVRAWVICPECIERDGVGGFLCSSEGGSDAG